jgi:hypothetical protein
MTTQEGKEQSQKGVALKSASRMEHLNYISETATQKEFDFTEILLHSVIAYSDELYTIFFDEVQHIRSIGRKTRAANPPNDRLTGMRRVQSDAMILVMDKLKFENRKLPSEWYELLHPGLHHSIVLCDSIRDSCYDVQYFPFLKMGGIEALKLVSDNVIESMSPCEMMAAIANGNPIGASVYVMPYSFARRIVNKVDFKIIWPTDGYIPVPI